MVSRPRDPRFKIFEGGVAGQVITTDQREGLRPRIELAETAQEPETLGVTSGYFRVLGLTIRGRDFSHEDELQGAEPVAIISDRLWHRRLRAAHRGDRGRTARKPVPIRVIGVAPAGFEGARRGEHADLWIPTGLLSRLAPADWRRGFLTMMVFARLGAGQTVSATERRYYELMDPRMREVLLKNRDRLELPRVLPLSEVFGTPESPTLMIREGNALLVVSGLTVLVLLGGCATIAALVLTHYERRRAELALKMSLGAGRRRLVFELVRDLSWVGATGTAGGMLVALLGARVVPALSLPGGVNIGRLDLSLDWRVCAVAIAATVVTLFVAAVLPIARSTRLRLAGELFAGLSDTTLGSLRIRQALLALQVCSTIVVLVAAGLFVKAVLHGFGRAAGFDVNRTVFVSVQEGAPFRGIAEGDPRPLMVERANRIMPALRGLSGVSEVAEGIPPLGSDALGILSGLRTIKAQDRQYQLRVGVLRGSPNLLSALGVPILAGRVLTAADSEAAAPRPALITQSLAERLWPGAEALGETLSMPQSRGGPYVVVGIARDLAFGSLARPGSGVVVTAGTGMSAIVVGLRHQDRPSRDRRGSGAPDGQGTGRPRRDRQGGCRTRYRTPAAWRMVLLRLRRCRPASRRWRRLWPGRLPRRVAKTRVRCASCPWRDDLGPGATRALRGAGPCVGRRRTRPHARGHRLQAVCRPPCRSQRDGRRHLRCGGDGDVELHGDCGAGGHVAAAANDALRRASGPLRFRQGIDD